MGLYLTSNQQQIGPYEIAQVNQMLVAQQIGVETLAWQEGMPNWEPISSPTFAAIGIQIPQQQKITNPAQNPGAQTKSPQSGHPTSNIRSGGGSFTIGSAIGEAFSFFKANPIGSISWLVLSSVLSSTGIGAILAPLLAVNFFTCAKRFQQNGTKMTISDLFDFSNAIEKMFGPLVLGIIIAVGFAFFIIPGIILSMWWTFSPCVLADRPELSFIEAIQESRSVAKGNWIKLIILFIAIGFLQILGVICLGVGLLVTIPVGHIALYFAYDQCKNSR